MVQQGEDSAPAELAIGDTLDPDLPLHLHDPCDRLVLDDAELRRGCLALIELLALLEQLRGALERTNVVRAERREELRASSRHHSTSSRIAEQSEVDVQ